MKKTISRGDFVDAFERYGRAEQLGGYYALNILFAYLEAWEEDAGEELELDVLALCSEWSYYEDGLAEYNLEHSTTYRDIPHLERDYVVLEVEKDGAILVQD